MSEIDRDIGDPAEAGEIAADNFRFAVEELARLFDGDKDEHGWPKGPFGAAHGVSVGAVSDYKGGGDLVYLAVRPNHGVIADLRLGRAFLTMTPTTAAALAALLRLAVEKARRT